MQHANNKYAVLHISHAVLPGCSLYDSVVTLVIVRNGSSCNHESRRGNLFTSNIHTLHDDADEPLGQPDFGRDVNQELVDTYTSPSDWVLNLSITSGK